jgi:hypothetical protein
MPLTSPALDNRRFADLREEALARIPVHTPEWTNFNASDPGVTLVEVFAFLTESLLYRANQIPERNRLAFLRLLGVQLQPAASASGLVAFENRIPRTVTLNDNLELRAGELSFRTTRGLDVLPLEGRVYYKRRVAKEAVDERMLATYEELYASYQLKLPDPGELELYEAVPLQPPDERGVDIAAESVDGSLWVALLAARDSDPEAARREIAGKTLSLGIVPSLVAGDVRMLPGGQPTSEAARLIYELPLVPPGGILPEDDKQREAGYRRLEARPTADVLVEPGVVDLTLPGDPARLTLWSNLDPLEAGVGDFPPTLEDDEFNRRLVTWLRVRPDLAGATSRALDMRLLWAGINATTVSQRSAVLDEPLPAGTGEPDQTVTLARSPVLPGSVTLTILEGEDERPWQQVDDFAAAGPEVPAPDRRAPPGRATDARPLPSEVFVLDTESGVIRFGDGVRGKRPPRGAVLRASYDYGAGEASNVGAGAIKNGPALPDGLSATNAVRTWGGANAERVADGERQVSRYLQHRDRLVTAADFHTIAWRTPGVAIGRVEVLPAFHPNLSPNEPGDAPGVVTLMLIPRYDPLQPDAPVPDRLFLDAVCAYLDPRRLVTTELILRQPAYKPIWVSIGMDIVSGASAAVVREEVKRALLLMLSPLPAEPGVDASGGWPLRKAVVDRELMAVATRVPGVLLVNDVLIAEGTGVATPTIAMRGLDLPRVLGISVVVGEPVPLDQLRGGTVAGVLRRGMKVLPVPHVIEECR